ncbi:hypothetical protein UA08_01082 [Talaromyces atroroseus]|uniref:GAT domain-containing protein n=1 Tax=Talaromyces atroroseus TaxID=1441469 RepID=A0A225BEB9_TALAT|nr:hypothetical protein UA08_01082 [Talaromyces atroroseus]OKL64367.1 hypothetical protein UA08_01082 [Talaromyces atroroseus]
MKRMLSGLQRRVTSPLQTQTQTQESASPSPAGYDTPEAVVAREITNPEDDADPCPKKAFCESGSEPGATNTSSEYVHLPAIVEAAESSAAAAKEASVRIRKYLSSPAKATGTVQYNAIMLIRILSENPGHSFTRNFDAKFVSTVKELLRQGRDLSTQQMLRETLETFETQKSWDEDLAALLAMWKKEKSKMPPPPQVASQYQQPHFPRPVPTHGQLPPPEELASRISEAKTSANLLIQLSQSTPAAEVQSHELMREFSQRCQAASRSIQSYMAVENPPPDENTLLTLIETNDQLSVALSKYQRTLLNARRAMGSATPGATSPPPPATNSSGNSSGSSPVNGISNGETTQSRGANASPPFDSGSAAVLPTSPPPMHSSLNEPFSTSALPRFEAPASSPPPASVPASSQPAPRRYEYNADEFNVENPFADNTTEEHSRS